MQEGVSVIVCCYNSSKRLPETIRHLALQEVPKEIKWEVIVVNNGSTDDTVKVAHDEWEKLGTPTSLRIVEESTLGLSFAREKGINAASYNYCIFCDDDNWLQKSYVRIAYEAMEMESSIGVIGGCGEAKCEIFPPNWFEQNKKSYAVGEQAKVSGDITLTYGVVYGAGAVINRNGYKSIIRNGFRSFLTDRRGKELSTGHDYEVCYSLALLGYKIFYVPELRFSHFIPKERLTKRYLKKLNHGVNSARPILSLYSYSLKKSYILEKRFLWLRETLYSLVIEIKDFNFKLPYTLELLRNRRVFNKALSHIKSFKKLNPELWE